MGEETIGVAVAVLQARLDSAREAIALQAKEYERRLSELNHAHQQQIDRNAQYVSREAWELRNGQVDEWRREVDRQRWTLLGVAIAISAVVGMAMRLLGR